MKKTRQAIINQRSHLYTEETGYKVDKVVILAVSLRSITNQNNHSKQVVKYKKFVTPLGNHFWKLIKNSIYLSRASMLGCFHPLRTFFHRFRWQTASFAQLQQAFSNSFCNYTAWLSDEIKETLHHEQHKRSCPVFLFSICSIGLNTLIVSKMNGR